MPSILEALEQKYGESSTESEGSEDEGISVSIFVPCRSPRAAVPALLVLNDCDIATAGEKDALMAKCAGVEELDLAKNKLNDWPEVSRGNTVTTNFFNVQPCGFEWGMYLE